MKLQVWSLPLVFVYVFSCMFADVDAEIVWGENNPKEFVIDARDTDSCNKVGELPAMSIQEYVSNVIHEYSILEQLPEDGGFTYGYDLDMLTYVLQCDYDTIIENAVTSYTIELLIDDGFEQANETLTVNVAYLDLQFTYPKDNAIIEVDSSLVSGETVATLHASVAGNSTHDLIFSTENQYFDIVGDKLRAGAGYGHSTSYTVELRVTDATETQSATVTVQVLRVDGYNRRAAGPVITNQYFEMFISVPYSGAVEKGTVIGQIFAVNRDGSSGPNLHYRSSGTSTLMTSDTGIVSLASDIGPSDVGPHLFFVTVDDGTHLTTELFTLHVAILPEVGRLDEPSNRTAPSSTPCHSLHSLLIGTTTIFVVDSLTTNVLYTYFHV